MCRAVALSIVLTLAAAQNAVLLLCTTRCDAHASAAIGCHHKDSSTAPNVAGSESCDTVTLNATPFLREAVRGGVSPPDPGHAGPALRYQLFPSTISAGPGHEPGREWSLEKRPLSIALRI